MPLLFFQYSKVTPSRPDQDDGRIGVCVKRSDGDCFYYVCYHLMVGQQTSTLASILSFSWQLVGGVGIGLSIGLLAVHIFHKIRHIEAEYFYIYLISIVLLSYSIANAAQTSGMLSSFFAGFVIGNKQIPYKKGLMAFCNSLSFITNVGLFILLGLLAFPGPFRRFGIWV
jgi:NhaP-type Na+/H+ and K+/H+ antiporter